MDNIVSKLTPEDKELFEDLLKQTFQQSCSNIFFGDKNSIIEMMRNEQEYDEHTIQKVEQLKKALNQRTGCIIIGDVKSGKSFLWKTLKAAMCRCGEFVETFEVNPKALLRSHLFGKLDFDTGEWRDGVITALVRKALLRGEKAKTWIVCDGDIDPEWIESLNSVLDDNRLLTLPTGERLPLSPGIKFIFETRDLTFASPATISRNGIICMNRRDDKHSSSVTEELDMFKSWAFNHEHFVLVGQAGCGRDTLINQTFLSQSSTEIRTIYCNEDTTPQDVIDFIEEFCSLSSTPNGLVYQPANSKKIALVLKNIECVGFDSYGCSTLFAFFHHWFDYGGFYDKNAQFIQITGIQVIFISTSTENFVEKSTHTFERLKKKMRVGFKNLFLPQDIINFVSIQLVKKSVEMGVTKIDEHKSLHLAKIMVNILNTAGKSYATGYHCCTPLYILNKWIENLTKYSCLSEEMQSKNSFAHEARRSIENFIFDVIESSSILPLIKSVFHKQGIDYPSEYYFSPLSHSNFSLITMNGMKDSIAKSINFNHDRDLQLNSDVLRSLSDIQHALYTGTKNALILGRCNSGRKTLVKLSCQINSIKYSNLMVTNKWNVSTFRAQFQQVLIKAGIEKEDMCIHVEEYMLTEQKMISMLCQILSGCDTMLKTFFDPNQLKNCFSHLYHDDSSLERNDLRAKQVFLSNIKKHLHICISLGSSLDKANILFQRHPSLRRDTEVVLVRDWNEANLKTYIKSKCDKVFCNINYDQEHVLNIILKLHNLTKNDLEPLPSQHDLMQLVEIWSRSFCVYNKEITDELNNLNLGMEKLNETNNQVSELKTQSKHVEQNVANAQSSADDAMEEITTEMTKSQLKMNETKELKLTIEKRSKECKTRKDAIESEITKIRPVLEASQEG